MMQQHDQKSHVYSKEGGALQAAYLERATRKHAGFLRRIMDNTIAPKFLDGSKDDMSRDQGAKEFEEWRKQHNGEFGSTPSQAELIQAAIMKSLQQKYSKNSNAPMEESQSNSIDSTPGKTKECKGTSDFSSHELQEFEEINNRWCGQELDPSLSYEGPTLPNDSVHDENNGGATPPEIVPMSPDEQRLDHRGKEKEKQIVTAPMSSSGIQAKYLEIAMQSKKSNLQISNTFGVISPFSSTKTKEFTAQKLPVSTKDHEAQTGLLQADLLQRVIHKKSSSIKKSSWVRKIVC